MFKRSRETVGFLGRHRLADTLYGRAKGGEEGGDHDGDNTHGDHGFHKCETPASACSVRLALGVIRFIGILHLF